jgi:hypothetical protein
MALSLVAGCGGKNVPCDTDPSEIASAQSGLDAAKQKVASAESDLASAKQQKTDLERKLNQLPDPAELESRLDELKKGSGR